MDVVYANFNMWVSPTVLVEKGQIWDASDPVVTSHPDWFSSEPSPEFVRRSEVYTHTSANSAGPGSVNAAPEQATADPGEKRSVSKADQSFDEAASLRDDLEKAGVKVDKRWGVEKLREEYAKAAK